MGSLETLIIMNYALIGLTGALSLGVFGMGLGIYLVRLGTERRLGGIRVMQWGVRLIFLTFVLIGVLYLLER